jgi:hypothetical protein
VRDLVDECLPLILTKFFPGHEVRTAQQVGWAGIKNSELLSLAEANFDAFLTADRNLKFQQSLTNRRIAIIVLPSNRLSVVRALVDEISSVLTRIEPGVPGQYIELVKR